MADSSAAFKADRKLGDFCIIIILQIQMAGQTNILLTGFFNRSGEYIQLKRFDLIVVATAVINAVSGFKSLC